MSEKIDQPNLASEIEALAKDQIKLCKIPISVYVQEAGNLQKRATLDVKALTALGMSPELLDRLKALTTSLFTAEVNWQELQTERKAALEVWREKAPSLYTLRKNIIEHLEFAFRKEEHLIEKITDIKEGDSHADAIEDLARLAVLGNENKEYIKVINYDLDNLEEATLMANEMGDILATANGYHYRDDDRKLIRDKTYTLLKQVVDEVREYGKFAFRNDKEHVKGYASKYERDKSRAYRKAKKENIDLS